MTVSEFERKTGISRDTLRYYEKLGMLTPPQRKSNGYRCYGQVHMKELAFIERGKAIGFSLSEIKRGYERYKKLGKLCPEFLQQLHEKKEMLSKRIMDDRNSISEIDKMLKKP